MSRSTEYLANIEGFTSYAINRKPAAANKGIGFNVFKAAGYVLCVVVLLAVVIK